MGFIGRHSIKGEVMAFLVYLAVIFFCMWVGNVAAKLSKWLGYAVCIVALCFLWCWSPHCDGTSTPR